MKIFYSIIWLLLPTTTYTIIPPSHQSHTTPEIPLAPTEPFVPNVQYLESTQEYKVIVAQHPLICALFYETPSMDQTIDTVAQYFTDVLFLKVDLKKFPSFAEFRAYPAILLYKDNTPVDIQLGTQTVPELSALLHNYFGECNEKTIRFMVHL